MFRHFKDIVYRVIFLTKIIKRQEEKVQTNGYSKGLAEGARLMAESAYKWFKRDVKEFFEKDIEQNYIITYLNDVLEEIKDYDEKEQLRLLKYNIGYLTRSYEKTISELKIEMRKMEEAAETIELEVV